MRSSDPGFDDSAPPRPAAGGRLRRVHRPGLVSLRAIAALILREMATTYGRSPGGYAWAVLQPALGIAFLTAIFSMGFRTPPLGTNFAIFYATGLVPFFMYNDIAGRVGSAVGYSRPLLGYPAVTFIDALAARFLLTVLTQLLISYLLITFIRAVYETQTVIKAGPILAGYAMLIFLAAGVGAVNAYLSMRFPIYQQVWGILSRPMLFISGVIFLYDSMPLVARQILWWNPLVHVIGTIRSGFYVRYDALYASPLYVCIFSGVLLVTGLLLLTRFYRELLEL